MNHNQFNRKNTPSSNKPKQPLKAVERIKLKSKYLKLIVYKLPNGESAITLRQMAVAVKTKLLDAKSFIKSRGISPDDVTMQNKCEAPMVPVKVVADFWSDLNSSSKRNIFTQDGQELLADYLKSCGNN